MLGRKTGNRRTDGYRGSVRLFAEPVRCEKIFAATGSERNNIIVLRTSDVALYHLSAWLPNKMGHEIRKERYELALKWLEGVQAGKIIPDLPTVTGEDGEEDVNNPVKWGSGIQNTYIW